MVTFRLTAKVAKRLKADFDPKPPRSSGLLGDWYVNLLIIQRQHILLLVSDKTLLPVLMPARDLSSFPKRFPAELAKMLQCLGIPESKSESELLGMSSLSFAKTASRQVLGIMNDFASQLNTYMDDGAPLLKQAMRLSRSPCGPLGMESTTKVTASIFGTTPPASAYAFDFLPSINKLLIV